MDILILLILAFCTLCVLWRVYCQWARNRAMQAPSAPLEAVQLHEQLEPVLEPALVLPEPIYSQATIGQDLPAQAALELVETVQAPAQPQASTGVPLLECMYIIPGDNDRTQFDPLALQELADSIQAHGLAQPITVRPIESGRYQVVAGERRFRACRDLLGWSEIQAIVRVLDDEAAAAVMLAENIARADLNPMDEARAYKKRMHQFAWTMADCARNVNLPAARVKSRLQLLLLIDDAQLLVQSGNLGLAYAEAMADLDANRQIIALRYFQQVKRPAIGEYKALCNQLLEQQACEPRGDEGYGTLFDLKKWIQAVDEGKLEAELEKANRKYPTNPRIPQPPRAKTIGAYFEDYIALLQSDGYPESLAACEVVGTVYDGAKRCGLAKVPKSSPLSNTVGQGVTT